MSRKHLTANHETLGEMLGFAPRLGAAEIARDLRSLIHGARLNLVSSEAQVLVMNLQGSLAADKKFRQSYPRRWRKNLGKIEAASREIEQAITALNSERVILAQGFGRPLRQIQREAAEKLGIVEQEIAQRDVERIRNVQAIFDLSLSAPEVADLILSTDGVNWRTGERDRSPTEFLSAYIEACSLPDRVWTRNDGRGKCVQTLEKIRQRELK